MEESRGLGRARGWSISRARGELLPHRCHPSTAYLGRDAPELGVFAAAVGAVLVPLCDVVGTAIGVHLCHALLRLPTHQPAAGR